MALTKLANIPFQGQNKDANALGGLASHRRMIVLNESDMSGVVNNGVIYDFPTDAILERVYVKNTGTTAFVIATTAFIDDGTTHQTADIKVLAANTGSYTYLEPVVKAKGSQLLWDLGGANTSAATASCQIILDCIFVDDVAA